MVDMDKIISQEIMVMKMKEKIENKIIFNYFITGFLTVLFICLEWIIYPIRNTDEYYWGGYTYLSFVCFVLFIIIVYKIIQTISLKKKLSCIEIFIYL